MLQRNCRADHAIIVELTDLLPPILYWLCRRDTEFVRQKFFSSAGRGGGFLSRNVLEEQRFDAASREKIWLSWPTEHEISLLSGGAAASLSLCGAPPRAIIVVCW